VRALLFKDRAAHPEKYAAHDAARRQLLDHLHNGRFAEAADVRLAETTKSAPGAALALDALQLTGEAQLLADRLQQAEASIAEAVKVGGASFPHQSVNVLLLLSEALRRAGNDAAVNGQSCFPSKISTPPTASASQPSSEFAWPGSAWSATCGT
jgi:hypothetical protein